jgi:hypothetical protein
MNITTQIQTKLFTPQIGSLEMAIAEAVINYPFESECNRIEFDDKIETPFWDGYLYFDLNFEASWRVVHFAETPSEIRDFTIDICSIKDVIYCDSEGEEIPCNVNEKKIIEKIRNTKTK